MLARQVLNDTRFNLGDILDLKQTNNVGTANKSSITTGVNSLRAEGAKSIIAELNPTQQNMIWTVTHVSACILVSAGNARSTILENLDGFSKVGVRHSAAT